MGNRHWPPDEFEYLSNNLGLKTHDEIAGILGRTVDAVKVKAHRNRLSYYDNFYSYSMLERELGISRSALRRHVKRGLLSGRRAKWRSVYNKCPMMFTERDVVRYLQGCNGLYANRAIPNIYFRNVYKQAHRGGKG